MDDFEKERSGPVEEAVGGARSRTSVDAFRPSSPTRVDSSDEDEEGDSDPLLFQHGELSFDSELASAARDRGAMSGEREGNWTPTLGGHGFKGSVDRACTGELLTQVFPSMLLSLCGACLTGMVLKHMQTWRVFVRIEELFILVPILLNLKGNLEMNVAARLSTSANLGELDIRSTRRALILGNLALLQVQALLAAFLSGLLAFSLGMASRRELPHPIHIPLAHAVSEGGVLPIGQVITESLRGGYFEVLLVLCVSMLAASLSSAVLGSFMCSLVVLCRRFNVNPDNIATPMASTLGDLVTLTLLGLLSTLFSKFMGTIISSIVFLALIAAVFFNYLLARRNAFVKELLGIGWSPLFLAMVISSVSGLILKHNINRFDGFALLTPVVTTLSGNAGTIFVSRISTSLHAATKDDHRALAARLFGLTTPIILGFLVVISATDQVAITPTFALAFVGAVILQVSLALLLGYCITLLLWRWDYDPDVYALPLLASALDFSGQLMVWAAFAVAQRASMFADLRDVGGLQPR